MQVLWICSVLPEGVGAAFGLSDQFCAGWLNSTISEIRKIPEFHLDYLTIIPADHNETEIHEISSIRYIVLQYQDRSEIEKFFSGNHYDLYHVYGLELKYTGDIEPYLPLEKTLFYIQGFASACDRHYFGNMRELYHLNPLQNLVIGEQKRGFAKKAETEARILQEAKFITGRTSFDRAVLFEQGCTAKYYPMNESLRDIFYQSPVWNVSTMERHSIFVSQASYPIKGTWMIAEILNVLKETFPDVRCYISGYDLTKAEGIFTRLGCTYASLIRKLIMKYHLEEHMIFIGSRNAAQMAELYRKANCYLLASTVENSSNSLQEAMFLGTPCVSSFVGGVSSIVSSAEQALLYPADDITQGAYAIARIFEDDELAESLSVHARERMKKIADREKNVSDLIGIYKDILKQN